MISKRTMAVVLIIAVILTGVSTFTLGNVLQVSAGDKVVITKKEYQELTGIRSQFADALALKQIVQKDFYKDTTNVDFGTEFKRSVFQALGDPYSVYFSKKEFQSFQEMNAGTYGGIGVIVAPGEDGRITVVSPIENTPGERAGLKPGDQILKVDGKDVSGDKIDEAVSKMKGVPGTAVTLTIQKKGASIVDVKLTREQIVIKSARSEELGNGMGYLKLNSFDDKSAAEFKTNLDGLMAKNIKGLIIDLRNNPGGNLDQCVKIADLLLGEQTIVVTKDRAGHQDVEKSDANKINIPYVLLVNEGSASASEILTGAVKDTKSGVVIGTKTFGKGIVQEVDGLPDGSGYKLTVAQYFTPNGSYIHGKGIQPDITIEMPKALKEKLDLKHSEDPQFLKAEEVLKSEMK